MSTTPVMIHQGAPQWGSLALVTYLPDPLGAFLTGLRQSVDGEPNPEAHITFLPPRSIPMPVEQASVEVEQRLRPFPPFEVELGSLRIFPRTNILYLDVKAGHEALLRLHGALNTGGLFAQEPFEFIPHLTLSGSLPPEEIEGKCKIAERIWGESGLSARFWVSEVVLLWQPGAHTEPHWTRLGAYPLGSKRT